MVWMKIAQFAGQKSFYNSTEAWTEAANWLPFDRRVGLLPKVDYSKGVFPPIFQPVQWEVLSGSNLQAVQSQRQPNLIILELPYFQGPQATTEANLNQLA